MNIIYQLLIAATMIAGAAGKLLVIKAIPSEKKATTADFYLGIWKLPYTK